MILKLGGKFLDGNLFVEKQNSGKLKTSMEHIKIPDFCLGKILTNIHAVLKCFLFTLYRINVLIYF